MESPQKSQPTPEVNIDINSNTMGALDTTNESRVGLSKEELMKYANMPFWVRLRNILFASFWIIWVSILVGAIGYVLSSPGCMKGVSASTVAGNGPTTPGSTSST